MATRTKKNVKAENNDQAFMGALEDLCKEKGIAADAMFNAIENALVAAYKKNFALPQGTNNISATMDHKTGTYHVYAIKTVVDEVEKPVEEISLAMAQQISPNYAIGDTLEVDVTPADFSRLSASQARQQVVQFLREAERNVVYNEYSSRQGDVVTGVINRIEKDNVYIDLGKTEALLLPNEQIKTETYAVNQRLKALIVEVRSATKGAHILVSRTHPDMLRALFELEVPEIHDGVVEIKSVAREPGDRSKIAVYAKENDVDPIGACVGHKGFRVQAIVDELRDEKIDIVKWNEDPAIYIANALSPSKVVSVEVNLEEKSSRVVVPDYQLSLAIGKKGQNARLAAKLTGWKIDIKSETQAQEEELMEDDQPVLEEQDEISLDEFADEEN